LKEGEIPEEVEQSPEEQLSATGETYSAEEEFAKTVDFSSVKKKEAKNQKKDDKYNGQYLQNIAAVIAQMEKISPNLKAIDRFKDVSERYKQTTSEFEKARDNAQEVAEEFNGIKQERYTLFMNAFTEISDAIDKIYKDITHNIGSRAYLTIENLDEPYLEGIKFNAIPPHKGFRDMEQLSGGEKTVAALALLFAIQSFKPSPFFVLDEVDAALDPQNVHRVAQYIKQRSTKLQCLVISLKDSFFEHADALVGIYKDRAENCSRTLTLDLQNYPY